MISKVIKTFKQFNKSIKNTEILTTPKTYKQMEDIMAYNSANAIYKNLDKKINFWQTPEKDLLNTKFIIAILNLTGSEYVTLTEEQLKMKLDDYIRKQKIIQVLRED